ncbi:CDP-6-deoxy-delta-3,4-glucoseen reductase [Ectothiorhodospiraceae bacterium 2226]|nr:CDP-6-deoxy-delta-3,4-glucoseen reductase [Ectothiorhodospiraceae bacterium 2226]
MSFKVRIEPSGHEFRVEDDESILEAALRQGFAFPYGCRNGACGSCKGKVLEGGVDYGGELPPALSAAEAEAGQALFCQAHALGDVTIEVREIGAAKDIPIKTMPCRVAKLERLADDVMAVYLKLPMNERLQYLAGQYLDILLRDGRRRSFSIANAPHDDEFIELHIKHIEGGRFTHEVFSSMKEKQILRIEGPLGNFYLREDSNRPIILMAGGTGFGPIKAIVEHAIAEGLTRPMHLYWGARTRQGLYMDALVRRWTEEHPHIEYVPVLSAPLADDHWDGRTGYVQDKVMEDFEDLSAYELYASGPPRMVYEGRDLLMTKGADPEHYYSDAFEFAKD